MELTKRTLCGGVFALATGLVAVASGIAYADPRQPKFELVAASAAVAPYTQHFSRAARTTIMRLRLAEAFDPAERGAILGAVAEWNHVLNGHIRFEVDEIRVGQPAAPIPGFWAVVRASHEANPATRSFAGEALAVTMPQPTEGGLVIVFVDRLIGVDLKGVMLHELGHTLGLDHDPRSHLMASRYLRDDQKCIDKATVEIAAALLRLPLAELNWCTTQNKVWSSYRDENRARPPASRSRATKAS